MNTAPNTSRSRNRSVQEMVLLASFIAIVFLLAFSPIGYINLPFIKATVVHIPVIIGSLLLGPKKGAVLGFFFGLTSLIINTMTPSILSFVFSPLIPLPGLGRGSVWALAVTFLPRILVGIVPWYVGSLMRRATKKNLNAVQMMISGVVGSMTNTVFVLGLIYLIFRDEYAAARGMAVDQVLVVILGVVTSNGLVEALVAGVLTATICIPLIKYTKLFPAGKAV